ncbi:MAG TPA: penicillin acylase family protein [Gemmatimonadaceae bacterium]|nr:penicillin acylase family protein [Gemmatimonadaceae bacterium]
MSQESRIVCMIERAAAAALMVASFGCPLVAQRADTLRLAGLQESVEVLRDRWGINHIYARNEHDLFFAQGYLAARDRTFQFELWRRQATGTMAELLGPRELKRDIGARLFQYRGSMGVELAHYHAHGAAIVGAFVEGVNALVDEARRDPALVPPELRMLGAVPGRWTPEVVISRHQGLLGNITEELAYGRFVAANGAALLKKFAWFHPGPGEPQLELDPAIDKTLLAAPILELYDAFRNPVHFLPADLQLAFRTGANSTGRLALVNDSLAREQRWSERRDIGSNNWVVSARLSASGHTIMANDPHRAQAAPSLRSFVHLVAPGWNVIGGGEPVVPGVSIGHNDAGAWGLTVFGTDGEDLYVYRTNPSNPLQYQYRGQWVAMTSVRESIPVKGGASAVVMLKYTRHGPVVYEDTAHHVAYAVRAAWLEPGGAPYLASLRMDQAKTWAEFRDACGFSNIPGENMVWADTRGNIGWQAVGIAPIRKNWSGLVPVPGDGRYEWAGYLPIKEKPHAANPPSGFIATANNDLTPQGYPHRDAIGWEWADPYRFARISEVLGSGKRLTMMDMTRLQNDYLSIPARSLVPMLANLRASGSAAENARQALVAWDFVLDRNSVPAGIYEAWFRRLRENTIAIAVPASARNVARGLSVKKLLDWLVAPDSSFGAHPVAARDTLLLTSLDEAVLELTRRFGPEPGGWAWGKYHYVLLHHPLSAALNDEWRRKLEVGPFPRGGDGNTPGATGGGENQTSGASFRFLVETGDWDNALGTNSPGQSGNPASPHYRDLFELWKDDKYFPVKYSRTGVESVTEARTILSRRPR